uniref:Uncharacterized protein n=1 Tax=Anopheles coluzzii TaxID=1518534 RepID=A0A8W7PPS7_ANOCL
MFSLWSQRLLPVPPWFDRRTTKTTSFSWLRAARVTHIYHCQYAERVWEICLLDPSSWDAAARTHRTLAYTFKHTQTRRPPTTSNARRTIHPTTSNTTDCTRQHPTDNAHGCIVLGLGIYSTSITTPDGTGKFIRCSIPANASSQPAVECECIRKLNNFLN